MKHIFHKGSDNKKPTLLLLHGTGGTEKSLLPVAEMIDNTASVLSVRGKILESGMPRFFKRLAEGVLDKEDLIFRTKELHEYLNQAAKEYKFDRDNIVAIGYSNGANIAGSLLFHYKDSLKGAILHHPMVPVRWMKPPDLTNIPVFIGAGKNDPLCSTEETSDLEKILRAVNADVHLHWENKGHELSETEVEAAKIWYDDKF